jgi:lipid A 4'-phosphatase
VARLARLGAARRGGPVSDKRMRGIVIYAAVFTAAIALFLFMPQVDLATSRLFYVTGHGFAWADWPPARFVFYTVPWIGWGMLAVAGTAAIWLFLAERPLWRFDRKALAFLILSVALGPGLLVNSILKDHWGRARPAQIETFGGTRAFTAAPLPAGECARNCSFVSGHAALGFGLVAFAFLVPAGPRRTTAIAAALAIGALIGLARIMQGAHFLSDVVFAGLLVFGTTMLLHWWIIERDGLAAPPLRPFYRGFEYGAAAAGRFLSSAFSEPPARLALALAISMILILLSISLVDRPIAMFFHARDPDLRALFDLSGRLGLTYGYLTVCAVAFIGLHWGGAVPRLRPFAGQMRCFSPVPAFLFVSIAASGLVVDLLKLVFGRTRPKLLFSGGAYDFGWLELRPDHWSFPSGHSATIAALVTALWFLWPQHVLFYISVAIIVALSRVAVGAHYLSDVFAGAVIAALITWAVAVAFAKSGIDLAAARRGVIDATELPPWPCRRFGRRPVAGYAAKARGAAPVSRVGP